MLARSSGGTKMYNWAAEHPESVACLAGIHPVCNLAFAGSEINKATTRLSVEAWKGP